jgi:hypothetical protein
VCYPDIRIIYHIGYDIRIGKSDPDQLIYEYFKSGFIRIRCTGASTFKDTPQNAQCPVDPGSITRSGPLFTIQLVIAGGNLLPPQEPWEFAS